MGNPLRFYGTGETLRVDDVTIPARCAVEVTFRIAHAQFMMVPDVETCELIKGCFGRALQRHKEMDLYVLQFLSNHGSFLATPSSPAVLSNFMRDFKSTLACRLNNKHDRKGVVWERRYRAIPVADETSLEKAFRYILTHGTKENLVYNARHWPGVTSISTLLGGAALCGRWRDCSMEYERNRQRRRKLQRAFARGVELQLPPVPKQWLHYAIPHVPMPHWRHLAPGQQRGRVAKILADDELETKARHRRDGTHPLGATAALQVHPLSRPAEPKNSPAPRCHASTRAARRAFAKIYRSYLTVVRSTTDTLRHVAASTALPCDVNIPPLFQQRLNNSPLLYSTGPPRDS